MRIFAVLFFGIAVSGRADIALYHTVEIDCSHPETIRVFVQIHAPELMFDRETTDFTNIGDEWLDGLSETEMEVLLKRSKDFTEERFRLWVAGKWRVSKGFPFSFAKNDDANAPGSLLASTEFPNPGGELRIELSPKSEKRLQVAINRAGKFPETHDLAAGESVLILLPENPTQPQNWGPFWLKLVGIPLTVFALFGVVQFFKRVKIRA